jgi:phosphate transport system substrate-binding protein
LTQAIINMDKASPNYLLQDLHKVYVYSDPRTYPLSSYSYMILPTGVTCVNGGPAGCDPRMTTAKRQTLADFLYYSVCQGQKEMGPVGYSPLPINLVEASLQQTALLHAADPGVTLTNENVQNCHNPTFVAGHPSENYLAQIAPYPPSCDKAGAGPCAATAGITNDNPNSSGKAPASGGSGTNSGGTASAGSSPGATSSAGAGGQSSTNSTTGQASNTSGDTSGAADANLVGTPTQLTADQSDNLTGLLAGLAVALLLALLILPPVIYQRLSRTRPSGGKS